MSTTDTTIDTGTGEIVDPRLAAWADAPPSVLFWRAFRKHKLAVVGLVVLSFIYLVALLAGFIAPRQSEWFNVDYTYAPPQALHFFDTDEAENTVFRPHVYGYALEVDPNTYEITHTIDPEQKIPLGLFVKGDGYKLLGFIPADIHLFGPLDPDQPFYLLGADKTGHDLFSRIIHGTRVSMTVGLIGVALAFALGVTLGGISGYFGGVVDTVIQRIVEFFMSIPTLPLWLGLAAALPTNWDPLQRYFAITVILAIMAWTDLARVVRGRFISLRNEEFIIAARLDGNSRKRVIFRHLLPSFTSHLVASLTLSIPGMILAETALSFLGLGLQPPIVSWGVLLQDAQNIRTVATAPWLLLPAVAVVLAVLSLNFVGDGLRDAADPYKQ
ncbi:ABC transporter permease [Devosia nitrariae]|uniref:Peptide ABC transporter permease n=1 Tax=Devosia nitrariae TaxID=2071872 RepID=A0ABQ5W8S8_9HYPH|nr:ABC transporter permease [Devosia nitrariae]GLQ56171.1 peptide ABC transporter permease [Devosia nitrariae]